MSALDLKLRTAVESRDKLGQLLKLPAPPSSADAQALDFTSNDYLSLARSPELRRLFLDRVQTASQLFGSGGSRLIINPQEHTALEARLAKFFNAPDALVFSSGYDANVAFFKHIPQAGDIILHDEFIHASIYDGMRSSRARLLVPFAHNNLTEFRRALREIVEGNPGVAEGATSVFLVVESVYSMDGSIAPLQLMSNTLEEEVPKGNGHLVVDEAHATGVYGPQGRGIVAMCGLEDKCLARLHTFGKALSSTGAVLLSNPLIRSYLAGHGRAFIFTTAPNHTTILSVDCALDVLESDTGARLQAQLLDTSTYLTTMLRNRLADIPRHIISLPTDLYRPISNNVETLPVTTLPTAIISIVTQGAWELSAYLANRGLIAKPVVFPAVPKDKSRVRLSVNADKRGRMLTGW
ncbi:pyridoxal phosphate-dependent transferase [Roridomyces roridus]|uniref:Pyridoxal phosphate-dependent transferase n=1 Tax=Roridomyces roridus TaxID=1738132 RepID=A0AAD7CGW5_9AGAR|nr:pyridoxal phosphate-dependent transferase [Roridomyces roridus]